MTITPLPTPPSRNDPEATFVSRANDFLGALPTFGTQANALAAAVNADKAATQTAAAIAPVSLAAANFKGSWSALTGALAVPASVFHSDKYWTLASDLADVTAKEPGVDAEWLELPRGVDYQEFTASGTWTKPEGATLLFVELIGGGGGGAASLSTGADGARGGTGGGIFRDLVPADTFGATESVVVGAGGAAAVASESFSSFTSGGDGGNSSFGGLIFGGGGSGSSSNNQTSAGASSTFGGAGGGGVSSTGVLRDAGVSTFGGDGGAGAVVNNANATAVNGQAPGGGGGGAVCTNITDTRTATSGAGGDGRVRVWAW
jgi:hypothetical protein